MKENDIEIFELYYYSSMKISEISNILVPVLVYVAVVPSVVMVLSIKYLLKDMA